MMVKMRPENIDAPQRPSDVLRANKAALLAVLEHYRVTDPRIFGSVVRGEDTVTSDVDILVSKTSPMSYATIGRLRRDAAAALGCPVDLVFENALKPEVEQEIKRDLKALP